MKLSQIRRGALRASSALSAVSLLGVGLAAVALPSAAAAQDYTAGAISGQVTDEAGNSVSGATITVSSSETGISRSATSGASGNFRFAGLPSGSYDVVVTADGYDDFTGTDVRILASQTADLGISLTQTGTAIVVTGARIIRDFTGTTTGLNVDLEELTKTVPVARDLTSVMLLAPGTSEGDDGFGNLASIGGSSVAENAYYLNGLNITNFDNYLGSARVPFEFYKSVEVKSGGYSAEFGRATGGIVNAVSKSGSNEFTGAVHLNWEPNALASQGPVLYNLEQSGAITKLRDPSVDKDFAYSGIVEMGGPIIKDRLFAYGLVEFRKTSTTFARPATGLVYKDEQDDPFWGAKIDAIPIDGQRLEFTIFDTRRTTNRSVADYTATDEGASVGTFNPTTNFNYGGLNYVGKYTGTFTDWLTVSGAYGIMKDRFDQELLGEAAALPYVLNNSSATINGVGPGGLLTSQVSSSRSSPYSTKREFYRGDVDLYFNILGEHHIRAGFDVEENTLSRSTIATGGDYLYANGYLTDEAYQAGNGGSGYYQIIWDGSAADEQYVDLLYYNSGGTFTSKNKAFYIQDEWSVTDRLTLNLGVRRDDFRVNRADGAALANLKENYAPRLGFEYELFPEVNGRIYGNFAQYYLPIASNTAYRNVGEEYYWRERFILAGIDSNGLPVLGDQITPADDPRYGTQCPFTLTDQSVGGATCRLTGNGAVPPSDAIIADNLKATKQSEYILGYRQDLGDFAVGIAYTYRNLDRTAEDSSFDIPINQWCADNGQDTAECEAEWFGYHQYVIWNPGNATTVNLDGLDGQQITLTKDQLSAYGKAKRTYHAVELTFDRKWDGDWSLGGSYTWSVSKGNSEGFVQSDFEQDDAGITQDFDVPEFTEYAYGYLPNHRRHRFKLFGAVALSDQFTLGMNGVLESPRKLSCLGYYPVAESTANLYGAASHYCSGEPAPRGEGKETDWFSRLDVSARYNVEFATGNTLTLRADVFNLLNSRGITGRDETGDYDLGVTSANYGNVTGYQSPRYVRLGVDIGF